MSSQQTCGGGGVPDITSCPGMSFRSQSQSLWSLSPGVVNQSWPYRPPNEVKTLSLRSASLGFIKRHDCCPLVRKNKNKTKQVTGTQYILIHWHIIVSLTSRYTAWLSLFYHCIRGRGKGRYRDRTEIVEKEISESSGLCFDLTEVWLADFIDKS